MVLQKKSKPAGRAYAGNSRWRKGERNPVGKTGQLFVYMQLDCLILLLRLLSFLPRLQGNEKEGAISSLNDAKKAETDYSRSVFDTRSLLKNLFDLARSLVGAIERSGVGQL